MKNNLLAPGWHLIGFILLGTMMCTVPIPASAQLCGPDVEHSTKRVKVKSPLEMTPLPDKGLIFVLSPTYAAGFLQMKMSMDGEWIGINQYRSYFVSTAAPGEHDFCSKSGDNAVHLKLIIEPGHSYYLRQDILTQNGIGKPATNLIQLSAEDAAFLLKKCQRIVFWEKGHTKPKD